MHSKSLRRLSQLLLMGATLATAQQVQADTIKVDHTYLTAQTAIVPPIQTSENNIVGQPFNWDDVFNFNTPMARVGRTDTLATYGYGDALLADSVKGTLRYFTFSVQVPQYTRANLVVEGVEVYRILHNGRGVSYINELTPQRHTIGIAVLTKPQATDSLRIRFEGDSLGAVAINPTGLRPYTLEDQTTGRMVYNFKVSPSGKLLFASYADTDDLGKAQYYSTITEIATGKVLHRSEYYMEFTWLPNDKDRGYFTRESQGQTELVVIDPILQESRIVARYLPDNSITLSPTGDYLIISKKEEAAPAFRNAMKYVVDPDDRQEDWRNANTLLKYDIRSGVTTRLSFGSQWLALQDISPDGQKLLLTGRERSLTGRPFSLTSAYVMDVATLKVDTIVRQDGYLTSLKFAPHGKIIAAGSPEAFGGVGNTLSKNEIPNAFEYELYLLSADGQQVEPLTKHFDPSVGQYKVHHHSGKVYFSADDKYLRSLYCLDVATKRIEQIPLEVDLVGGFDVARRGTRLVYTGQWNGGARNLYTADLAQRKSKHKQIGDTNIAQHLQGVQTSKWTTWNFVSERGDTIHGNYLLPYNFDPAKKYPVIVYYYGGVVPTPRYFEFAYPYQVWAAQGYIVYVVQPSGAVGFGQKFASKHVNTWGKGSADDVMEGTRKFVEAHSFANADKIGCIGASYGGFMTQYLIANSKQYAAAISHAGISNIASYWGSGTWGYSYNSVAASDSYPWNNPDLYTKHSPLFNADKITTPLLLLHGTVDNNVPPAESMQMYTALRLLGREVALVEVEGENHIINQFDKRRAWQTNIFAWFAKHLKDQPQWWQSLYPEQDQFAPRSPMK